MSQKEIKGQSGTPLIALPRGNLVGHDNILKRNIWMPIVARVREKQITSAWAVGVGSFQFSLITYVIRKLRQAHNHIEPCLGC